jgi:hypothetical protein
VAVSAGMETLFYTFLILSAFYFDLKRRYKSMFFISGLIALTRIDGLIVLPPIILSYLVKEKKLPIKESLFFFIPTLPWFIFSYFYFGSVLPHSLVAKKVHDTFAIYGVGRFNIMGSLFFVKPQWIFYPIALLVLIGISNEDYYKAMWAPLSWTILYGISYALLDIPGLPWYYPPFVIFYILLMMGGIDHVFSLDVEGDIDFHKVTKKFAIVFCLLVYLYGTTSTTLNLIKEKNDFQRLPSNDFRTEIGKWLNENSSQNTVIAAYEIGQLGYYSKRKIIDILGLVSPETIPHIKEKDFMWIINEMEPDYVFIVDTPGYQPTWPIITDPWFQANYAPLKKQFFSLYNTNYILFKRNRNHGVII